MTEQSMFWTDGLGDGGAYSQDQLRLLGRVVAGTFGSDAGVVPGALNKLAVTSTGNNNITIATGAAIVDGVFYSNDGVRSITTPSPSVGTTGRRVVLQKAWAARTIRLAVTTNTDGTTAIPPLVQTDGVTWEIPLASFTITTGGVIGALTDLRVAAGPSLPTGSIIMWSGTIASIPLGFLLCDGTNGTPNLLARFVKGVPTAGTNPGTTGGSSTHSHADAGGHTHSSQGAHTHDNHTFGSTFIVGSGATPLAGPTTHSSQGGHTHDTIANHNHGTGSSDPAYFEVAFLMKS